MVRLSRNPGTSDKLGWNEMVQLTALLRKFGLKDPDVPVLLRHTEIIQSMVDTMRSLIDAETSDWNSVERCDLPVHVVTEIAPGIFAKREFGDSKSILVGQGVESASDGLSWRNSAYFTLQITRWEEIAPGVQARWTSVRMNEVEVRTRTPKEPVVEEAGTADAEAGWRRPMRYNLLPGRGLDLAAGLSVERELAGSSWRFQNWEHVWSVVDGSAEWRDVTPEVQIRWPNGPSDSLIAVRKRVLRGRF